MTNASIWKVLWWVCLVIAPAVLVSIELYHPANFTAEPGMYQYLSKPEPYNPHFHALGYPGPHWWFTLHMIQTPMTALVAVGLWIHAARIEDSDGAAPIALAWIARAATLVFIVYYTALDSIGGFGLGRTIIITEALKDAGKLTPDQVAGIATVLNATWTDTWVGGVGSVISKTGSWAVFAATLALAVALLLAKKAPWPALILLVGFGWELQVSHTMPHGPIAFGLLIASSLWMWFARRRAILPSPAAPSASV